jgi:hypothetical protein
MLVLWFLFNTKLFDLIRRAWTTGSNLCACQSSRRFKKGGCLHLFQTAVNRGRFKRAGRKEQFGQGHVAEARPYDHPGSEVTP